MSTSAMPNVKSFARYGAMGVLYAILVAIPMIVAAHAVESYHTVSSASAPSGSCATSNEKGTPTIVVGPTSGLSAGGTAAGSSTSSSATPIPPADDSRQVPVDDSTRVTVGTQRSSGGVVSVTAGHPSAGGSTPAVPLSLAAGGTESGNAAVPAGSGQAGSAGSSNEGGSGMRDAPLVSIRDANGMLGTGLLHDGLLRNGLSVGSGNAVTAGDSAASPANGASGTNVLSGNAVSANPRSTTTPSISGTVLADLFGGLRN